MKQKFFHRLLSAVCAMALLLTLVPTAFAAGGPAESNNYLKNYYNVRAETMKSYLYENSSGGLTRVEYLGSKSNKIIVEDYSSSFQLQSSRTIPMELSIWGGFYAGSQYNYLIFGQGNPNESDSVEVIRVVKYSKDWQRLGQASVYGANTYGPFSSGSVRCAESGGYLYIHTCHTMYKTGDGLNHQANMTVILRENDMTVTRTYGEISVFYGYVSHSFNQFIMVDSLGNILTANHGDGIHRAMILYKFNGAAGTGSIDTDIDQSNMAYVQTERFMGNRGENRTNAQLGGVAETSSGYLLAYAMGENKSFVDPQQVHLSYIAKNDFGGYFIGAGGVQDCNNTFQDRVLTSYTTLFAGASAPHLVPTGLDGGWIMWNEVDHLRSMSFSYAQYNANGTVGAVKTISGDSVVLSDCQPIVYNGKVVWYTTHDSAPVFYTLDASGVKSYPANGSGSSTPANPSAPGPFTDVPANHWARSAIESCVANGSVSGYGNGKFGPEDTVTSVQFIAMLTRTFHASRLDSVVTPAGQPWYYANIKVAEDVSLSRELTIDENPMSRYDMALALYNELGINDLYNIALGKQSIFDNADILTAKTALKDWDNMSKKQKTRVGYCYALGILTGMSDGTFSGDKTMTRAQACAVITRMMNLINA